MEQPECAAYPDRDHHHRRGRPVAGAGAGGAGQGIHLRRSARLIRNSIEQGTIMDNSKFIEIQHAEMKFDTRNGVFHALQDVNLTVAKGEFVTLIGHSGCGKSTLLNLIAGLLQASDGTLLCANREIAGPSPERGVVFQNHSLLPWLTCFENVYLAVERVFGAKEGKVSLRERTRAALAMVG